MSIGWAPDTAFLFFLIFARVGTILMLLPAIGEQSVPARMRLSFAVVFTLVLFPLITPMLPGIPGNLAGLMAALGHELAVGLILGGLLRLLLSATQVAGAVIAYQMGLSMAQTTDPTQGGVQGAIVGNFLSFLGITLIFATDLHHMLLAGVYDSYTVFPPDAPLMLGDAAQMAIEVIAGAFRVGVQMAAPLLVFGLVFYLGLGVMGRLMPQIQVFFMAMPANIIVGLLLFALLLTLMMGWYLAYFEENAAMFLA